MLLSIRLRRLPVVAMLAVAVLFLSTGASFAQAAGGASIGLINVLKIQRDAKASVDASRQLKEFATQFDKEFEAENAKAMEEERALTAQRSILSPEAYAEKRAAFKNRLTTYTQQVQARRMSIDQSYGQGMKQVQDKAMEIAQGIAKERGFTVILLRNSAFLVVDEKLDITDEVLVRLDKALPSVKLVNPVAATGKK